MNELEHLVQVTLLAHEKDAPDEARLLDDVRLRVTSRRRQAVVPLTAAALVVAVTAVVFVVGGPDDEAPAAESTRVPAAEPGPTGATSSTGSPAPRPANTGPRRVDRA